MIATPAGPLFDPAAPADTRPRTIRDLEHALRDLVALYAANGSPECAGPLAEIKAVLRTVQATRYETPGMRRVPARAAALIALAFWIAEALAGAIALVAHYEWPS